MKAVAFSVEQYQREWLLGTLLELEPAGIEERSEGPQATAVVYGEAQHLEKLAERVGAAAEGAGIRLSLGWQEVAQDWATRWTEDLSPVRLSPTLELVPGAPPEEPRGDSIYLEPAFAFGFGEHATTRLIGGWVEQYCRSFQPQTVLDVGCGTGILSLIAARSGVAETWGVDVNLKAVDVARRNAHRNRLPQCKFDLVPGGPPGLRALQGRGASPRLVLANIEAPVLIDLCSELCALARNNCLALSGLSTEDVPRVSSHFERHGLPLHQVGEAEKWALLVHTP